MKPLHFLLLLLLPLLIFGQGEPVSQVYSNGNQYKAIALADYNDDGIVDVWSANSTNNHVEIWVYSNESDSLIMVDEISGISSPPSYIHDIAVDDLDKDGNMDAVVTLRSAGTYLCINDGGGSWTVSQLDGTYGWQVIISDFNQDQAPDILIATDWSYLKLYIGDGSGSFEVGTAPQSAFIYGDSKGMNAVDVDNDGDFDIIGIAAEWTNSGTNRYFMRAYENKLSEQDSAWGSFYVEDDSLTMLPNNVQSSNNSAGDLNGDGYIDQVGYSSNNDIIVYYGASGDSGYYLQKGDTLLKAFPSAFSSVSLIDLDDDSDLDVFAFGYSNFDGLLLFENDGSGNLDSSYIPLGAGLGEFHSVKGGDIDGNGTTDIIASRYNFDLTAHDGFQIFFFPENEEVADSIIYVSHDANGNDNGTSWEDAYYFLEDALANAPAGSQVWVANGTYRPGHYNEGGKSIVGFDARAYSFVIPDSVSLYGGFSGSEESLDERGNGDEFVYGTILNGDIGELGNMDDNVYHVVKTGSNNIIDGFVITSGNSNSASSPDDTGAGIYNTGDNIIITNCFFIGNSAVQGAGIANYRVGESTNNIEMNNCFFLKNKAGSGGGIGNWDCPTTIEHCVFIADTVTNMGGAIFNWGANSDADIIHCTFYGNAAGDTTLGGAVHSRAGGLETNIVNSIFWNNSSDIGYGGETHGAVTNVYYSDVQHTENIQSSNNISENPMFVDDTLLFNLSLQEGSSCIDAGTELLVIGSDTLFSSDSSSYNGAAPDMGAIESNYNATALENIVNAVPQDFELMQNYPNPFNPVTTIRYKLAENAHVNLTVYDIQGRRVKTLVDAQQNAGSYSIQFKVPNLASGVYIYKITAGNFTKIKKMILVR